VVNDAFSISPREIELRYEKLVTFHQHSSECCNDYCTRFEKAATELTNLGKSIPPNEQGYRVYTGIRSKYRQIIYNHMTSQHVPCTISNMTDMVNMLTKCHLIATMILLTFLLSRQIRQHSTPMTRKPKVTTMAHLPTITPRTTMILLDRSVQEMNPLTTLRQNIPRTHKQSDNSKNLSNRQYDGKKKSRKRKSGENMQVHRNGSHDNSNKYGNKPSQPSTDSSANSAVVYQTSSAFNPSKIQVQEKFSRHSSIDLGNPPPGMQYAIFPNGQHWWVPSTTQPIFLSPPYGHSPAPQSIANSSYSRNVQQYSNQQYPWRNDSTRGNSRGNTQPPIDNMVANAVSDSNAISTPYDNEYVDGSDYSYPISSIL